MSHGALLAAARAFSRAPDDGDDDNGTALPRGWELLYMTDSRFRVWAGNAIAHSAHWPWDARWRGDPKPAADLPPIPVHAAFTDATDEPGSRDGSYDRLLFLEVYSPHSGGCPRWEEFVATGGDPAISCVRTTANPEFMTTPAIERLPRSPCLLGNRTVYSCLMQASSRFFRKIYGGDFSP